MQGNKRYKTTIRGKGPVKHKDVLAGLRFMLSKLGEPDILDKINLTVRFVRLGEDDGQCNAITSRKYQIDIKKTLSWYDAMATLGHELVHLVQYYRKDLEIYEHLTIFHGKHYYHDEVDYYDRPHEIEAHGREEGLVIRFIEFLREQPRTERGKRNIPGRSKT